MKRKFIWNTLLLFLLITIKGYAYNFQSDGIYYNIEGDNVYVTSGNYTGNIVIPDQVSYNGKVYAVTGIGISAFLNCTGLSSVTMPNSVTSIGNSAFSGCLGLSSITISNSVTSIGESVFSGCSGLTSITIPNSVTSIGDYAFYSCSGLTSITIPNSVTSIGYSAFSGCSGLTSITIPNSVTTIGTYAFSGCSGLSSIKVDNNNPKYDSRNNCNAIIETLTNTLITGCKNSVIPNSVTTIGKSAFSGCSGLTSITIPNSVTSIGNAAFYSCTGLTSIVSEIVNPFTILENTFSSRTYSYAKLIVPTGTKSAYQSTNYWNKFTNIEESNSTSQYKSLNDYIEESSVKEVGTNYEISPVINNIKKIYVDLRESTTNGSYCFMGILNDNENKNIDISSRGLQNTTSHNLTINSNTNIKKHADNKTYSWLYYNPDNNNEVIIDVEQYLGGLGHIKGWQKNFGTSCVSNIVTGINVSTKRTIHVATAGTLPDLISESEKYIIEELTLTGELNGTDFRLIRDMAGCNYKGEETSGKLTILDLSGANVVTGGEKYIETDCIYGNGVSATGNYHYSISQNNVMPQYVFYGCHFKTIHIPNSVTKIGNSAFYHCNGLTSLLLPKSITDIDFLAFAHCNNIVSIEVESENSKFDSRNGCNAIIETSTNTLVAGCKNTVIPNSVKIIGRGAFDGCTNLTSISIPNSVTKIEDTAFSCCSGLTSILIPNSVTRIEANAFYQCSGLTSLTIPSSVTNIGYSAFEKCTGLTSVVSEIVSPFTITENTFSSSTYSYAKLTVPAGTKSAYQSTNYWNKFTNIIEKEVTENFTLQGIAYLGTTSTQKAEVQSIDGNQLNVDIPSSVSYDGKSYQVTSIANGVLSNRTFNYVSLPTSITEISSSTFSNSVLGALIWNADASLPSNVFSNMGMKTSSNFLLYVNAASYAPSNVKNVVVGNTASSITLEDATNTRFYCPKVFTAQDITYTHHYGMTTGGSGMGWETITLPFDVARIEHATKGVLTPFALYQSGTDQLPFWLYELGSNGFKRTDAIKANTPYIISMPNNSSYDSEYIMSGDVTFSATNAKVYQTSDVVTSESNGKTFVPAFAVVEKASVVYPLNVTNSLVSNSSSYDAGSRFIGDLRKVYPFEAYMTTSSSNRVLSIDFDDEGTTDIDEIPMKAQRNALVKVYSISGQLLFSANKEQLDAEWKNLPAGVYIVNGKKMVKM